MDLSGVVLLQLGMHMVYDVTHNTAKEEEHQVDGQKKKLLVHRKGATRAYPPGHPSLPDRSIPLLCQVEISDSLCRESSMLHLPWAHILHLVRKHSDMAAG